MGPYALAMAVVHELSRADARRVAVRAQLLTKDRPTDLVETVRRLTMLQIEPTSAIAPSAELVMWSRLGSAFSPQELWDALDEQRLIELHQTLRVPEDLALFRAEMAEWPGSGKLRPWQEDLRDWVEANNACRLDILERLRADGPLPSSELPDTCVVPWASSGWNNNRNLRMMIDKLVQRGEVAAAGGTGRDRLWDLASRIYPDDPVPPADEARRLLDERRLGALGIARATGTKLPLEPVDVGEAGEAAVVEGVPGSGGSTRPSSASRSPAAPRCCRRSTGWSPTASGWTSSSSSTTSSRCTSPPQPGSGATTRSRSCTATGWSGSSTPRPTARKGSCASRPSTRTCRSRKTMTAAVDREITDLARWLELELVFAD